MKILQYLCISDAFILCSIKLRLFVSFYYVLLLNLHRYHNKWHTNFWNILPSKCSRTTSSTALDKIGTKLNLKSAPTRPKLWPKYIAWDKMESKDCFWAPDSKSCLRTVRNWFNFEYLKRIKLDYPGTLAAIMKMLMHVDCMFWLGYIYHEVNVCLNGFQGRIWKGT